MMTVADIARAVRRGAAISIMLVCVAIFPAVPAQASSGHHRRTLTIHQAWTVTRLGHVELQSKRNHSRIYLWAFEAEQRRSPTAIRMPTTLAVSDRLPAPISLEIPLEVYTQCRDTGQVTEIAEQQFRFTSPKPRCRLIYNKTP
jgi:hypothetical protein